MGFFGHTRVGKERTGTSFLMSSSPADDSLVEAIWRLTTELSTEASASSDSSWFATPACPEFGREQRLNKCTDDLFKSEDKLLVSIGPEYQLDADDVHQVFQMLADVNNVKILSPTRNCALVSVAPGQGEAVAAILDGHYLNGAPGCLKQFSPSPRKPNIRKWTARYDIMVPTDNDFQITRRIIGVKGCNMKSINQLTGAKLRLRGRGSGYLEGLHKEEADDILHLCVSCTDERGYRLAREKIDVLLTSVYADYDSYCLGRGLPAPRLAVRAKEQLLPARG